MEQLIFIGLLVVFSLLEAAGRKRRHQGGPVELPPEPEQIRPRPRRAPEASTGWEESVRSRDVEVHTYDEEAVEEVVPEIRPRPAPTSSEGMMPAELWDEIARIARGEVPAPRPRPQHRVDPTRLPQAPPKPRPQPPVRAGQPVPPAARPRPKKTVTSWKPQAHPVHRTHPDLGKPPSERSVAPPIAVTRTVKPGADVAAVRGILAGGASALRQAVILEEVLGPPAALRGDPYEPVG